jgi:acetylornithine/succinyldiaminopimelate/putrescine aminotransferase
MAAQRSARRYLGRSGSAQELRVARTEGSYLYDEEGKRYVDFLMGWCVGNFGWGQAEIQDPVRAFEGPDYVYPGYTYRRWEELAELLASLVPGELRTSFRATGGTEAVELALQAAMLHTGRRKLLSLEGSYHGNSIATISIGDSESRRSLPSFLPNCARIDPPLGDRALGRVETRLKRRDVAAFIMEPISINLGVLIPERSFMEGLQRLCRRYGTLLVMDEVASGFGRTGKMFASEHFGVEPDVMCVAKAVTGGSGALGAMIATPEVAESMEEDGSFYSTYGWHPLSVETAIATLRWLGENRERLFRGVEDTSDYFRLRLSGMAFHEPVRLRIRGLAVGVDVGDAEYAKAVRGRCLREGLLLSAEDSTLLLLPALTVGREAARDGLDILERCL